MAKLEFIQSCEIAERNGNELNFEVSEVVKQWMEAHMTEVDDELERKFGETPHTIRFENFFNGEEDAYICECYF